MQEGICAVAARAGLRCTEALLWHGLRKDIWRAVQAETADITAATAGLQLRTCGRLPLLLVLGWAARGLSSGVACKESSSPFWYCSRHLCQEG